MISFHRRGVNIIFIFLVNVQNGFLGFEHTDVNKNRDNVG